MIEAATASVASHILGSALNFAIQEQHGNLNIKDCCSIDECLALSTGTTCDIISTFMHDWRLNESGHSAEDCCERVCKEQKFLMLESLQSLSELDPTSFVLLGPFAIFRPNLCPYFL